MSTKSTVLPDGREKVWILEMNSNPLQGEKKQTEKGKTFKFRGLCAEFTDDLNENQRLYDKPNYDDKASALLPKIEKRALLGELDHNEDFLVNLKNASHVITGLKDLGKTYEIEVELIPGTVQGNNAIALAEAGVPLFISSRASGYIDRQGNVTLEKIYTYDLVSEPGFKNAELVPVNESLAADGKLRQFKNRNVKIYRWTDPEHKGNAKKVDTQINKQNINTMAYATKADIAALEKQIANLKKSGIRAINESLQIPTKLKYNGIPVDMLSKIPQTNDVLTVDSVDFKVKRIDNVDESKENSPSFKLRGTYAYTIGLEGADGSMKTGYITKTGEFHIADEGMSPLSVKESGGANLDAKIMKVFEAFEKKINEIIDGLNAHKMEQKIATQYIDGLSKILEHACNEHDKVVHFVNLMADHSDNSTKVINTLIESSDRQTKRLNLITESLEATQHFVNEHAKYSDAQTNILNALVSHSDKATKHLNMLHKHSDQVTSMVNVHESKLSKGFKLPARATAPAAKPVNVNEAKIDTSKGKGSILETTKNILAKVNSNKTEESRLVLEAKYPFVKQFTEEEIKEFRALPNDKKDLVLGKTGPNARKTNVLDAIRSAAKQTTGLEFLNFMSKEKKAEWALLPIARKQNIVAYFQSKNLTTKTAIENFWDNIDLKPVKTTGLVRRVDESIEKPILEKSIMGYTEDDMSSALGL